MKKMKKPIFKIGDKAKFKLYKNVGSNIDSNFYVLTGTITKHYNYFDYRTCEETTMYEIDYIIYVEEKRILECDEIILSIKDIM